MFSAGFDWPIDGAGGACTAMEHRSPTAGKQTLNAFDTKFRDYSANASAREAGVREFYKTNHESQTLDFVLGAKARFCERGFDVWQGSLWEASLLLSSVVDESDPDTDLPQHEHALQTAEACRMAFPESPWMHLVGFVHDLGKVLAHPTWGSNPQWAVVGDTFPVGCAHDPSIIYPEFFAGNPDAADAAKSTQDGIYSPGCGLNSVHMSWGHDEYLYQVLAAHPQCSIPPEGLAVVRYHSFYALHQAGAYGHLLDAADKRMLPWLQRFQRCDLYTKSMTLMDVDQLAPYYRGLIDQYCPGTVRW